MNVYHVLPIEDIDEHVEFVMERAVYDPHTDEWDYINVCECKCEPKLLYEENGDLIVVHNSFDGREGVEWVNEILK